MIDLSKHPSIQWRKAYIPKKSGGKRELIIPGDELKAVQEDILDELYHTEDIEVSYFASGFVPYRNTIHGAKLHDKLSPYIINFDLRNFFPSFDVRKTEEKLLNSSLGAAKTEYIMRYCTYTENGNVQFPQGSPASPYLTNIGMLEFDLKAQSMAIANKFTYSRYADDMTFSMFADSQDSKGFCYNFIYKVRTLVNNYGLELNNKKTRICAINSPKAARRVTGVVIRKDGKGYNAPRELRHEARCLCHILWKKLQEGENHQDLWPMYRKMKGIIAYSDYLRSWSEQDVATADPCIDENKYAFIEGVFNAK